MANEVVKYDNDLNLVAFKGFSKVENDVFFALIWKLKEQGNKEIRLDFGELRSLIDLRNMTNIEISKAITDIGRKISRSTIELETETEIQFFTIFQVLAVPKTSDDFYIRAKVNEPFLYILNDFKAGNFTIWELMEFSNLTSKYSQTLYRLLKQFRSVGVLYLKWDKFLDLLDIPKSYNMGSIDTQILKPAIKELSERNLFNSDRVIFNNLRYEKIRGRGRGRPVKNINFFFQAENTDNKKIKAEKKEMKIRKIANENKEFSNQFYGQKFTYKNSVYQVYIIEKVPNSEKIKALVENTSTYTKENMYFPNIEILKNEIEKYQERYQNNNQKSDKKFEVMEKMEKLTQNNKLN